MPTLNQLIKGARIKKERKKPLQGLHGGPQSRATCIKIFSMNPKKPNSAIRKVAKVKTWKNLKVTAYIPGKGHNLLEHSVVLLRAGRANDLPGVPYKIIRGKYDASPVINRKTSRSKYGVKRSNK